MSHTGLSLNNKMFIQKNVEQIGTIKSLLSLQTNFCVLNQNISDLNFK